MVVERSHQIGGVIQVLGIGQTVGNAVLGLLPALQIPRDVRVLPFVGRQRSDDQPFCTLAGLFDHLRVVCAGIAGHALRHAQLAHLRDHQRHLGHQAVQVNHLRVGRAHLEERAGVVGGLRIVGFVGDDLAAGLLELRAIHTGGLDAGLVIDVDHRDALLAKGLEGVVGDGCDIDIRQRKRGIHIVAEFGDIRRIGADRQLQHLLAVGDRRHRLHHRAPGGHEHRYTVDVDQAVDRVDAERRVTLGVEHDHLQLLAVDPALGVDVGDRPFGGLDLILAEGRLRTGQWHCQAELEGLRQRGCGAKRGGDGCKHQGARDERADHDRSFSTVLIGAINSANKGFKPDRHLTPNKVDRSIEATFREAKPHATKEAPPSWQLKKIPPAPRPQSISVS